MGLVATELAQPYKGQAAQSTAPSREGRGFVPGVSASKAQVLLHDAVFEALLSNALRNQGREGKGMARNQQV